MDGSDGRRQSSMPTLSQHAMTPLEYQRHSLRETASTPAGGTEVRNDTE
jgi:hypothetical protein